MSPIPRSLHFVWLGSPLPDWARANIEAWRELHPGWGCVVWDEVLLWNLQNQDLFDRASEIVHEHAVGQFRADVARYEILHRHGGFYADVDTRPLRAIDEVLENVNEFAVAEDTTWVGNTYLASTPWSPVMRALIDRMPEHVAQFNGRQGASVVSGPQYMTPIWREFDGFVDERTELWFPYSWRDVKRGKEMATRVPSKAYAIHQWAHMRERSGRPLS